jgi:hypothetical protein
MKFAPAIIFLSLLLTACSRQNSKIVGTWKDSKRGTTVFSHDGSFSITKGTSTNIYWFDGIWKIENGILDETITNCSNTNWPWMGQKMQFHIIHLDGHKLEIEEKNPTIKYSR